MEELTLKEKELNKKIKVNLELIYSSILGIEGIAQVLGKKFNPEDCIMMFNDQTKELQENFKELLSYKNIELQESN